MYLLTANTHMYVRMYVRKYAHTCWLNAVAETTSLPRCTTRWCHTKNTLPSNPTPRFLSKHVPRYFSSHFLKPFFSSVCCRRSVADWTVPGLFSLYTRVARAQSHEEWSLPLAIGLIFGIHIAAMNKSKTLWLQDLRQLNFRKPLQSKRLTLFVAVTWIQLNSHVHVPVP